MKMPLSRVPFPIRKPIAAFALGTLAALLPGVLAADETDDPAVALYKAQTEERRRQEMFNQEYLNELQVKIREQKKQLDSLKDYAVDRRGVLSADKVPRNASAVVLRKIREVDRELTRLGNTPQIEHINVVDGKFLNLVLLAVGEDAARSQEMFNSLDRDMQEMILQNCPSLRQRFDERKLNHVRLWKDFPGIDHDTYSYLNSRQMFDVRFVLPDYSGQWAARFETLRKLATEFSDSISRGEVNYQQGTALLDAIGELEEELKKSQSSKSAYGRGSFQEWQRVRKALSDVGQFRSSVQAKLDDLEYLSEGSYSGEHLSDANIEQLFAYMHRRNLKFGPAKTPADEELYQELYIRCAEYLRDISRLNAAYATLHDEYDAFVSKANKTQDILLGQGLLATEQRDITLKQLEASIEQAKAISAALEASNTALKKTLPDR